MKVLVLAGGLPQLELMKRLRERYSEIKIILADYLEHPAAEFYADKFYRESTLDIPAIEKIARSEKVDFLITVCTDQALNTVAEVSEKLNLPCYIDAKTGKNVTNKKYMKNIFEQFGIPSSKYFITNTMIEKLPQGYSYPLVIKPVDCNSSKGVVKVDNDEELFKAVKKAIYFSRSNNAIIEEFVEGKELTVDVYVHNGRAKVLCISENEKVKSKEKFVIFRTIYPAGISKKAIKDIETIAQQIVDGFKLKNCPMLIQLLYNNEHICVLEFSARTGGGLKYQLIQQITGVDILYAAIDATIGQSKPLNPVNRCNYVVNEFMYCHEGVYDHVDGFQELQDEGIIKNYFVFKNSGTYMHGVSNSGDRIASITIIADTFEELNYKHRKAVSRIKVIDVNGRDIMYHEITYPLKFRDIEESGI